MATLASAPARELSTINFESMLGGPLVAVINAQAKAAMSTVNFVKSVGFKAGGGADQENPDTGEPIYVSFKYPKEISPPQPVTSGVLGIDITNAGGGYTTAPVVTVAAAPAGGTNATAIAEVAPDGTISRLVITNPGTGYLAAPQVQIPAPTGANPVQAAATARIGTGTLAAQYQTFILEVPILTILPIPFIRVEETTIDFNAKINSVEESKTDETFKVDATLTTKVKYPPLFAVASVNLKVSTAYQKTTQSGSKVDRTYSMNVHIRAVQDEMPAGMERLLGILEDAIKAQPSTK